MKAMWVNHDGEQKIVEERARIMTNKALEEYNFNSLSKKNFANIVDHLHNIGCVEISSGVIWLREWIRREWP